MTPPVGAGGCQAGGGPSADGDLAPAGVLRPGQPAGPGGQGRLQQPAQPGGQGLLPQHGLRQVQPSPNCCFRGLDRDVPLCPAWVKFRRLARQQLLAATWTLSSKTAPACFWQSREQAARRCPALPQPRLRDRPGCAIGTARAPIPRRTLSGDQPCQWSAEAGHTVLNVLPYVARA